MGLRFGPFFCVQWEQELPVIYRPRKFIDANEDSSRPLTWGGASDIAVETPPATPRLPPPPGLQRDQDNQLKAEVCALQEQLDQSRSTCRNLELKVESFKLKLSRAEAKLAAAQKEKSEKEEREERKGNEADAEDEARAACEALSADLVRERDERKRDVIEKEKLREEWERARQEWEQERAEWVRERQEWERERAITEERKRVWETERAQSLQEREQERMESRVQLLELEVCAIPGPCVCTLLRRDFESKYCY